ncbi:MAG: serine/threonine protein kinase, partial [Myxococcales bacterium]|nr:serine/threonine protein kinase [Myxococcales bacterium]
MAPTARSWNPRVHTVRTPARAITRRLVHGAATLDAGAKTLSDRPPTADDSVTMMRAGARLGRYLVRRPIGSGGMGTIYEAEHVRLGHRVAIKALHPELVASLESRKRFEREARSAARLTGPNVVRVIDVDQTEDGLPFMVMELLSGRDLAEEWARNGAPPPTPLVDIAIQCLAALAEAHGLGIVHRDVKPENVFLADEGGKTVVKLLDFGIAKLMGECPTGLETGRCDLYGTPLYMAPEQARLGVVDHRTDLFSLGTMLYRMLAGRGPFSGDDDARYLRSLLTDPALPLEIAAP